MKPICIKHFFAHLNRFACVPTCAQGIAHVSRQGLFHQKKALKKVQKMLLFHLKCSFHYQDNQVFCNFPLFCPEF